MTSRSRVKICWTLCAIVCVWLFASLVLSLLLYFWEINSIYNTYRRKTFHFAIKRDAAHSPSYLCIFSCYFKSRSYGDSFDCDAYIAHLFETIRIWRPSGSSSRPFLYHVIDGCGRPDARQRSRNCWPVNSVTSLAGRTLTLAARAAQIRNVSQL